MRGPSLRWFLLIATCGAMVVIGWTYARDMRAITARLEAAAQVVETAFGPVAVAAGGQGAPVLVIHGAGGGHDQGRLMAEAFLPEGANLIAPSRFGYPGSAMPEDGSTAAQADAFAQMLDALGLDRVVVAVMSGGVPPRTALCTSPPGADAGAGSAVAGTLRAPRRRGAGPADHDLAQ